MSEHSPFVDETAELIAQDAHLQDLGPKFMAALGERRKGRDDQALKMMKEILKVEPRLPEPRLEIGRIYLDMGRLEDAREESAEALRVLENGGQWLEDLPLEVLLSTAHGQLAEVLRQLADTDKVIFGDPEVFKTLLAQAKVHFTKARDLDGSNAHADFYAFYLGTGTEISPDGLSAEDAE